jgi:hypothetical protein
VVYFFYVETCVRLLHQLTFTLQVFKTVLTVFIIGMNMMNRHLLAVKPSKDWKYTTKIFREIADQF